MTKQNTKPRQKLVTPPRLYMNAAIVIGGVIGFLVQNALNMDNLGAFIVTGAFCFAAVILLNFSYLFYVRRKEAKQ